MSPFSELTKREVEIVRLIAQGYRNKEISACLSSSTYTVQNHVRHILHRLQVTNRTAVSQIYWQQIASKND